MSVQPGPYRLTRQILDRFGGDWAFAHTELVRIVKSDSALTQEAIEAGVTRWIHSTAHHQRTTALKAPPVPSNGISGESLADNSGFQALAAEMLMEYPLKGGLRLGDATKTELAEAKDFQAMMEREAGHRKRWFAAIEKRLKRKNQKVRDCLEEDDLRQLWEKAIAG